MAHLESPIARNVARSRFNDSLKSDNGLLAFVSRYPRRKRPNPQSEENIRRIDTKPRAKKQTHGFQVHFLRGDRVVTRMFSDNMSGGKQAATARCTKIQAVDPAPFAAEKVYGRIDFSLPGIHFPLGTLSRILEIPARNPRALPTSTHR